MLSPTSGRQILGDLVLVGVDFEKLIPPMMCSNKVFEFTVGNFSNQCEH